MKINLLCVDMYKSLSILYRDIQVVQLFQLHLDTQEVLEVPIKYKK